MIGIPVIIAENGIGFPVRPVDDGAPLLTIVASGLGAPIVIDEDHGTPFVVENLPESDGE